MRAVFRYPGSKWSLAGWIIAHFPLEYEKMVYLEPFAGSGAVFFNKNPGAVETVNDLDSDIVNLFRVLRDRPDELKRALELTPYSREEYDLAFEPTEDPLEKSAPLHGKDHAGHWCKAQQQMRVEKPQADEDWRNSL